MENIENNLAEVTFHVDMRSNAVAVVEGIALTAQGLQIASPETEVTAEQYKVIFDTVLSMHRASNWALGDTLLLAERQWGNAHVQSKYAEASAATGMGIPTLANIVATCKAFPKEKRHAALSFTHHLEAACIAGTAAERETALAKAEEEGMSCAALRRALRTSAKEGMSTEDRRATTGENDDKPFGSIDLPTKEEAAAALPIAFELSKAACWMEKHPAETLTAAHRQALVDRLSPIVEYARTLQIL